MFGAALERGPAGQIGTGLGQTNSTGTVSLIAPTDTITATGETRVVDGVRMEFQNTPGTEAPAEMNTLFPDHGALWMAENATHVLHNVLTIRGALVRDPRVWSRYLSETIDRFGERMDVVFASHHWPTWGRERASRFLSEQRDLYAYLHDQTLRLLNQGFNGAEIAETIELPPALANGWHARGYYGSVSHNVKAIYQRYMGWYDGNPARLWQHTPEEQAKRYVGAIGGIDDVVAQARTAYESGDLRWAAELLDRAIFADPGHAEARALQADTFEQLAYGAENGPWRNAYPRGRDGAPTGRVRDAGHLLAGPAARPHPRDGLRCHRHPGQRAQGLGRAPVHRDHPDGPGPVLAPRPAQRRAHPSRVRGRRERTWSCGCPRPG